MKDKWIYVTLDIRISALYEVNSSKANGLNSGESYYMFVDVDRPSLCSSVGLLIFMPDNCR